MKKFWFEIVSRMGGRFSWEFVEVGGARRVIARADRDFGSKKRAKRAVRTIQEVLAAAEVCDATVQAFQQQIVAAEIVDATCDEDDFELPASTFEIAPPAVPLMVVAHPALIFAEAQPRRSGVRETRGKVPLRTVQNGTALTQVSVTAPVEHAASTDDGGPAAVTVAPQAPADDGSSTQAAPRAAKTTAGRASTTKAPGRSPAKKASRGSPAARTRGTR